MKKSAQKKIKNNATHSIQNTNSSRKNLLEFFLLVPCFMLLIAYGFLHTDRVEAAAGVNRTINFQGRVVNKTGGTNVTDGTYTFTFKIYDSASAGNLLWGSAGGESQSLTVTNGIFQAAIGSVRSFATDSLDFNQDNLWLEISFNGETFGSRVRLASVPYALSAEKVSGLTVTQTTGTLTIANGKTFTANSSLTLTGIDSKTLTVNGSTTLADNVVTFGGGEILTLTANKNVSFADAFTTSGAGPATLTATSDGFTLQDGLTSGVARTLTVTGADITLGSTIKPTASGGLALDTNGAASFTIGASANAITIGNNSGINNTALTLTTGGSGNITLGSNTGTGNVVIAPNAGGKAALIVIDQGVGDLFTASASGSTKFQVTNGGSINIAGAQTSDIDTITAQTLKIGASTQNSLTVGRSGAATTINGSGLTIGPTSWTATPTISGLITATLGVSVASGQSYTGAGAVTVSSAANTTLTIDSGTTGALNIGTGANGKTITIGNSTANTALTLTTGGTGVITLGSNTGVGNILIQPNAGAQAALVINKQVSTGDLFTASASGTTRFRITNTGGILFQGDTLGSIGSGSSGNGSNAVVNALGDQGSLVPNAGFESIISNSLADGWFPAATTSAGIFSRDTSTPAKGSASLLATITNGTAAVYSTCIPVSGAVGQYTLNYYGKASNTKMSLASWIDGYTSKANCQADTSPTLSLVKSSALTTSWALYGSGTTAVSTFGSTATWARVHFLFSCTSACTSITGELDGVRFTEQSTGQGLDYAENYPSDSQNPAQAGDVVALKPGGPVATVVPATNQMDVVGVVSTNPGEVLDDGSMSGQKVPIALAGRIPTKVSTENGEIHIGDYLTSSDIPGVAVKALNAGQVIGVAMENYTGSDPSTIGKVVMFVKNTYYDGASGLFGVGGGIGQIIGKPIPSFVQTNPSSSTQSSTQQYQATPSAVLGSSQISFENLTINGLATISGTLRVKTNGLFEGILTVLDTLTTHNVIVNGVSDFFDTVIFHKSVQFVSTPIFSKDTAGFAVIHKGASTIDVIFGKEYTQTPIIQASLTTSADTSHATTSAQELFQENYKYVITNQSPKGFSVFLNKDETADVHFSWTAIVVDKPNVFESFPKENILGVQAASPSTQLRPTLNVIHSQSASSSGH